MKERPIIFNGEMVRAILDGRKTETRSVINPQPVSPGDGAYFDAYNGCPQWNWWSTDNKQYLTQIIKCPYGKPGDRLWVREKFRYEGHDDVCYAVGCDCGMEAQKGEKGWKPSVHMPRWASRITLEITDVRAERVQEITYDAAIAEGVKYIEHIDEGGHWESAGFQTDTPVEAFMELWNSINKARGYGWDLNPFVWVGKFKVMK